MTSDAPTTNTEVSPCCPPAARETCCDASEKSTCCGTADGATSSCGCLGAGAER